MSLINVPFYFQLFLNEIGFNKEGFLEGKSISEIPLTEVDAYHAIFVIRSGRGQMYVSAIVDLKNMKFKIKELQQVILRHAVNTKKWHGKQGVGE